MQPADFTLVSTVVPIKKKRERFATLVRIRALQRQSFAATSNLSRGFFELRQGLVPSQAL